MIISRTPHRISFFGGGTDYPSYYLEHGGKVLGVAIDKYCYINVRVLPPFFDYKHRIVYSKQENVNEIDEIQHPSVRETFKFLNIEKGKSIHHDGDIPARSGMGSSSAFTVGLLNCLYALNGERITKHKLTLDAIHIEQNIIKENVGSQDQTFAAYGGFNLIEFFPNGKIVVNPIITSPERLNTFENKFMLFFTGVSRIASEVADEQIKNIPQKNSELNKMKDLVDEAYTIITSNKNLIEFGQLLNETWKLKKQLAPKISNQSIDEIYKKAMDAGAVGGKLLGAGNGGFMLFYVEAENKKSVKNALKDYLHVPFKFDFDGSKIIIYEPNCNNL